MRRAAWLRPVALWGWLLLSAALPVHGQGDLRLSSHASAESLAPLSVTFTASLPPGHRVEWSFGDGGVGRGPQVTHIYLRPGRYTAQATWRSAQGRVVGRGEVPVEVRSAGPERAALTVLIGEDGVRLSAAGSVLYSAQTPQLWLDGRPVGAGSSSSAALPLSAGTHEAVARATSLSGQPLEKRVSFTAAPLTTSPAFEAEVLRLTNQARAAGWNCAAGRSGGPARAPLQPGAALRTAALAHAAGLALTGTFTHDSALDGSDVSRRVQATGLAVRAVAENIAAGQRTPQEVVDGWLRSPGHCANLMGDYAWLGVGYVSHPGSPYGRYWTQVFARP